MCWKYFLSTSLAKHCLWLLTLLRPRLTMTQCQCVWCWWWGDNVKLCWYNLQLEQQWWMVLGRFYFVNTVDSSAGDLGLIKCFVMLVVCHVVMCLAHGQSWSNEVKPFVARPVWYLVVMSLHYFDYWKYVVCRIYYLTDTFQRLLADTRYNGRAPGSH